MLLVSELVGKLKKKQTQNIRVAQYDRQHEKKNKGG